MKPTIIAILVSFSITTLYSQAFDTIPLNPSIKEGLLSTLEPNPLVREGMMPIEEYYSYFYPIYLDSDTLVDLIYIGPDPSLGESNLSEIYLNRNESLILMQKALGTIEKIEKPFPDSPAEIHFIQYGCCDDPHNYYQIWTLSDNNISTGEKYHFLEQTKLPQELNHLFSIRVLNTSYMLRCTPEINNSEFHYHYERGNIIAEFSTGDIGHVLATEEDSTGRLWYFVAMNEPDGKGFHNYSIYRNKKWLGWISSKYVEIINYSR